MRALNGVRQAVTCAIMMLLLGLSVPAWAGEQAGEQSTLRVTTRLVHVTVVVHDSRGRPIRDLKQEDFTVIEDGREQPIRFFSQLTSVLAQPETRSERGRPLFSNLLAEGGVPGNVTVILLDGLNTKFTDRAYARNQIIRFLKQLQPQDRVALFILNRELRLVHDFSADTAALVAAIDRQSQPSSAEESAAADVVMPQPSPPTGLAEYDFDDIFDELEDFYVRERTRRTLDALQTIGLYLGRVPGRKNLVWVSSGFPMAYAGSAMDTTGLLARTMRTLNDVNVAIYPVDARGLVAPPALEFTPLATRGTSARIMTYDNPQEGMKTLADRTGGRAFYNTNDIEGSIRRAIDDAEVSYLLGYYPDHQQWDGKFRNLRVRVNRSGVRTRYRNGYFALPEPPREADVRLATLRDAVLTPLDASAIGLTVQTERVPAEGARAVRLFAQIHPEQIELLSEGGRWTGGVDFVMAQRNSAGQVIWTQDATLDLGLEDRVFREVFSRQGLKLDTVIELLGEASELRLVARDVRSGRLGSLSIPVNRMLQGP